MDSKKAKHVIAKVQEKKGMSSIADMQTQLQKQLRSEAMRDILNTALLGAGVAGTARGGQGLWNLLTRSSKKLSTRPGVAPLPVPYRPSYQEENGEEKEAEFFKGVYNKTFGGGTSGLGKTIGQHEAFRKNLVPHGVQGSRQAASQYGKNYDRREAAQQTLGDKQMANTGSWWKGLGQDMVAPVTAAGGYIGGFARGGHRQGKYQASQAWNAGNQTRAAGQQGVDSAQRAYDRSKVRLNQPFKAARDKQAFTPAMLLGGGIGAGYGAGTAPKGEVVQNMTHHGARGLGAGAGTSLGSLLGAGGGVGIANLIAKLRGTKASPRSQGIGALAGLLTGGIGGGILGNKATRALLGESPKEREGKEDEQIEVLKQRAQQARQEGEDNNGFSFRKYSADKQAVDMPKPGPTSKPGLWWYMPSMLGAGALGGYGGWKLIDHILDKRRRQEIDDEVDESRNEFQEALVSQYKRGSDSELGVALDELYNKMNKESLDLDSIVSPDTRGRALGAYATYAIPSSILGYLLVKGLADRGSRGKILEKAQRSRALKQQQSRPAELYAVPTPIDEEEE